MKIKLLLPVLFLFQILHAQVTNSILWRISGKGLQAPSYLLGTIHIKDKRVFNFPDSLLLALDKCHFFAMEIDADSLTSFLFKADKKDTSSLRSLFSKEEYEKLNAKLEKDAGVTLDQIKRKDLRTLRQLLGYDKPKSDDMPTFLDAYLYGIAHRQGKVTLGLESIQSQKDLLSDMNESSEDKEKILKLLETSNKKESLIESMIHAYTQGNLDELASAFNYLDADEKDKLLYLRNIKMASRIDSLVKINSLFVAVGAGHLPGDKGLIELLRKKGYTLQPVSMVNTGLSKKYPVNKEPLNWKEVSFPEQGYSYRCPGQPELYQKLTNLFDLYMYYDAGTGCVYSAYGFTLTEDRARDEDKLLNLFVSKIKETPSFSHVKQKKIQVQGSNAVELSSDAPEDYQSIIRFIFKTILFIPILPYNPVIINIRVM